jgi:hypothetical protein
MPDYRKLQEYVSHRVVIEYDTGARISGYIAAAQPGSGQVQLIKMTHVEIHDASGNLLEKHDELSVCPNVLTGVHLAEGPRGRDLRPAS